MTDPEPSVVQQPPQRLFTVRRVLGLSAVVVLLGTLPYAQTRQAPAAARPATPADNALQALNRGQYAEVDQILGTAADARSLAIRARALIERGRYPEAEKLLTPLAGSQPGSDAALELGRLQLYLGRRADGLRTLNRLTQVVAPNTAAEYMRLGLAAQALGAFQDANAFFRSANRLVPQDALINLAWGELFLEKYNRADAMKSFQAALEADPANVAATLGVARIALEENPPAAKEALERALKTNPGSVPAHLLSAASALDDRKRDEARASIAKALETNPNSLEARALDVAVAFLEGRTADMERLAQEVLKINPTYGEVFRVVGEHAGRNYRFDEAVVLVRRALTLDPTNTRAYGDLGMHLLRTGDEPAARVALERAFKEDPFDVVKKNSLDLLDSLAKFETLTDGDIVMRLHPDEVAVMREQAMPLAKESLATLEKKYQFEVTGPILVEMFPKHDDFAVRTLGLPGFIGALGACFGRVVTLDSPRARPPGQFSWQATLWHEMAHVITLQMSNNRVPRWLSEGFSQWEERRARPEWGHESELEFAQAMNDDKVFKLDVLSEGFSDPRTINLAYQQASLVVEYLSDTYGDPALWKMLRAYGRGLETEEAFKEAFGVGLAEVQVGFDARIEKDFANLRRALQRPKGLEPKETPSLEILKALAAANPESFPVQMQLAQALYKSGDKAAAIPVLEAAEKLVPRATGGSNPNVMIATIALELKDNERAIRALEALLKVDPSAVEAARKLTSLVGPLKDDARAEDAYRRLVAIDPFDSAGQTGLGRLLLRRKDAPNALRAFRSAIATNPPDRAAAHTDLAEAYLMSGDSVAARTQVLAALEIAPSFERAQDLLLKLVN
jgi:tetratricopeptide (TPR) repeat protein